MNTPRSRLRPALPHDVLVVVASFADRKSLLALLATSHSLHSDCAKYVLQDPVVLHDDWSIASFICFMRPHKRKRWRHLHSLCLRGGPISSSVAEALARVIPRAYNLQSLEFEDAEETLGAHPDLPLAFAALRTVKHIIIENGYQHMCTMFEAMQWPLESAVLRQTAADSSDWQDPDGEDRLHPAAILKNSRATLKTLECDAWSDCSLILPTYPVYPKLESLSVAGVWCPRTAQWATSYPSLKQLTVHTVESHFSSTDEDELADQFATRSLNMNEYTTQAQQWDELERFHGDVLDLYLIGFTCRIRDLSLSLYIETLQFFPPIMETARPTHLRLLISTKVFGQSIPTYLHDPGLADLKSLELDVDVWVGGRSGYNGDTDVVGFLVSLLPSDHPSGVADILPSGTCLRSPNTCLRPEIHLLPKGPKLCFLQKTLHSLVPVSRT